MKRSIAHLALSVLAVAGCSAAETGESGVEMNDIAPAVAASSVLPDVVEADVFEEPVVAEVAPTPRPTMSEAAAAEDVVAQVVEPQAIARRIARQQLTVYARPTAKAPVRGRIPMAAAFDVFAYVEGPGCEGELGWADLGHHGYACMNETRKGEGAQAYPLPRMRAELTPFYYAKVKPGRTAPRYRRLSELNAGAEPVDTLKKGVDYAFVVRRRSKGQVVLLDEQRRAVREADVQRFRPSRFEGRDLEAQPVPEGKVLAWVSNWPEAPAYEGPSKDATLAANLGYHDQLLLEPATSAEGWYRLENGAFVAESDVRVFAAPTQRPEDVGTGDIWIDVDLEQQTLAVMLGEEPIFATLVSSGFKSPTPRGLFRIHNKLAVGSMSSAPGAGDFYDVQAVPHVQYFQGSFALHSAYWHDAFGRPISHGCVNLSPKDAKRVFSLTTPSLPNGWIHGYESTEHLGTTVRIHAGDAPVPDRRGDVDPLFGR